MRLYLLVSIFSLVLQALSLPIVNVDPKSPGVTPTNMSRRADMGQGGRSYAVADGARSNEQQPSLYRKDAGVEESHLEPRLLTLVVEAVDALQMLIRGIVGAIKGAVKKEQDTRGTWTQWVVQQFKQKHPGWNVLIVHVKHHMELEGKEGVDWIHRHIPFINSVVKGSKTWFDVYVFRKGGDFLRGKKTDRGYLNIAYSGRVKSKQDDDRHIVFGPSG